MVSVTPIQNPQTPGSGGRVVSVDGRSLPLEGTKLSVSAMGGVARVILEQRFRNVHAEALSVSYLVPMPAEAAISGFSFRVGKRLVEGEVDRKRRARERFEQAIVEGKTAAIVEEARSTLFRQQIGNIPAGETIVCELIVDQRLVWLAEGAWEWRFPTVVGARYLGAPGRTKDAAAIAVDVADGPIGARMSLELEIEDALSEGGRVESPSHPISCARELGKTRVGLGAAAPLDRDVVVRWPVARREVGASLFAARPADPDHGGKAYGLLTLVPPEATAQLKPIARDLIVLLDTSGSMGGVPLEQAKRVTCAMIDALGPEDELELIEFSSYPSRFRPEPIRATRDGKRAAIRWVEGLEASGSTEMQDAIVEALAPLRPDAQRQIVVITDGYIGFEHEILETVRTSLPRASRVHTVGVGSAVNRSLTEPLARAGAGVEVVLGLSEDVERAARRLLDRTVAPLLTELRVEGLGMIGAVPARLPDVFARSPVVIAVELAPKGGDVIVRGKTAQGDDFAYVARAPALALGEGPSGIVALFGRERVADLEVRRAARADGEEIDAEIEAIGLRFQIATRLTSWVAIGRERLIPAGASARHEVMPHEAPHGVSIEGMGLRRATTALRPQALELADDALRWGSEELLGAALDEDEEGGEPTLGFGAPASSIAGRGGAAPAGKVGARASSPRPAALRARVASEATAPERPTDAPARAEAAADEPSPGSFVTDELAGTLSYEPKERASGAPAAPSGAVAPASPKIEVLEQRRSRRLATALWIVLLLGIVIGLLIAVFLWGGA